MVRSVSLPILARVCPNQEGTARYRKIRGALPPLPLRSKVPAANRSCLIDLATEFKNPEGQIARWIERLQEYDVEICHRKGSAHGNADALSRRPCPESCKYCSRIEKKFSVMDPIVRQVTTPSTSALDPWTDESVRKDQLADPEIKPTIEFKESSDEKPSYNEALLGSLGISSSEKWCFISKMGV
ncbi:retrovirus-related Pol polyprotein from transposon 412 [Trichonephila clavipes]|nr:retrovirus-related Pol polyprotein from transposon 412 [Trichonephila clavipes]